MNDLFSADAGLQKKQGMQVEAAIDAMWAAFRRAVSSVGLSRGDFGGDAAGERAAESYFATLDALEAAIGELHAVGVAHAGKIARAAVLFGEVDDATTVLAQHMSSG